MKPDHKYYDITELIQRWSEHGVTEKDLLKYGADGKLQFSIVLMNNDRRYCIELTQYSGDAPSDSGDSNEIPTDDKLTFDAILENWGDGHPAICDTKELTDCYRHIFDVTAETIKQMIYPLNSDRAVAYIVPWCEGCERYPSPCENKWVFANYQNHWDPDYGYHVQKTGNEEDTPVICNKHDLVVKHAEFLRFDKLLDGDVYLYIAKVGKQVGRLYSKSVSDVKTNGGSAADLCLKNIRDSYQENKANFPDIQKADIDAAKGRFDGSHTARDVKGAILLNAVEALYPEMIREKQIPSHWQKMWPYYLKRIKAQ